ncbi:hypothetical protein A9Q83_15630 [Alphaproteobacteria bacterium 46_93_T64]|nr:hypothetical protein A9Q83_15630 [Alphaproteobacteria bacterium 46_93_T64]
MAKKNLLKIGVIGTAISALCCFTPILVIVFATMGISAFVGMLDYILLPSLATFAAITLYAFLKRRRND